MGIRAVFFDLDDTLCDTIGTREARARLAFQSIGPAVAGLACNDFLARVMAPKGERDVHGLLAVVEELGLTQSAAGRSAIATWFFEGCTHLLRPLDGVIETVDLLRTHYRLGVITNGGSKAQRMKWLKLNLPIDLVVISSECGFDKPDPRIFRHACSLAEVPPSEAVFVGDRPDVDIAGAKAAGMWAVWFNHWCGAADGGVEPDAVIERMVELPRVVASL